MDRKEFIKTCGYSCLSIIGFSAALQACTPTKYMQSTLRGQQLTLNKTDFIKDKNGSKKYRHYIIVKTESLNFPIVLYRHSDMDYRALLLQCPHQSMELNVNGDLITCSAHGSEFNNNGEVMQGPAEQALKQYLVTHDTEKIHIHLT